MTMARRVDLSGILKEIKVFFPSFSFFSFVCLVFFFSIVLEMVRCSRRGDSLDYYL